MHTEFEVIIFDRAENHFCGRLKGDCCLKSLKEKQIMLYSQHLQKKTIALMHQEWKKYMKCCENHIFVWKLSHFYVFFYAVYLGRGPRTTFVDYHSAVHNKSTS